MKLFLFTILLFLLSDNLYSQNEILKFFPIKLGDNYYNSTNKIYSYRRITIISNFGRETDTILGKLISRQQIAFNVSEPQIDGSESKRIWALFKNDTLTELHLKIEFKENDYLNAKKQYELLYHDILFFYNHIEIGNIYVDNDEGGFNNQQSYWGKNKQEIEDLRKQLDSRNGIKIGEGICGINPKKTFDNMSKSNLELKYEHPIISYTSPRYDYNTRVYIIEMQIFLNNFFLFKDN